MSTSYYPRVLKVAILLQKLAHDLFDEILKFTEVLGISFLVS